MIRKLSTVLVETVHYLYLALKALRFWHRPPPVTTPDELVQYVETRAKFVAQTTLYGYVKTRAGTRYVLLFDDAKFVQALNIAKWEIYLACLCDLAVFCAASVVHRTGRGDEEARDLAIYLVNTATRNEEIPPERPQGFEDVRAAFENRAATIPWAAVTDGEAAFAGSIDALVEWAPIADQLKVLDAEAVRNSIRFKWKKVRDQLDLLLDAESILAAWRARKTPDRGPAPAAAS